MVGFLRLKKERDSANSCESQVGWLVRVRQLYSIYILIIKRIQLNLRKLKIDFQIAEFLWNTYIEE